LGFWPCSKFSRAPSCAKRRAPGGPIPITSVSTAFSLPASSDLLDGRLARLGGKESPFGREFDSLADIVSFGVAPALLVFKIVLYEIPHQIGWLIAGFYLLCGALRLARFNIAATYNLGTGTRNFTGFPIPAAAGLISSITLLIISNYETRRNSPRDMAASPWPH